MKNGELIIKNTFQKDYFILEFGFFESVPFDIYFIISISRQVDFFKQDGEILTRFYLKNFLANIDNTRYNIQEVTFRIFTIMIKI